MELNFSMCVSVVLCRQKCQNAKIKPCPEIVTLLLASKRQIVCVGVGEGRVGGDRPIDQSEARIVFINQ